MSFILDALKKAETERSRQSGPVLMDVRVAAPRRRLPTWAWVLGAVLVANLALLAWMLLKNPTPATLSPPTAAAPAPAIQPAVSPAAGPIQLPTPSQAPAELPATSTISTAPLPAVAPAPPNSPVQLDVDNLPTAQDLLATGVTLPVLQLNLHVYDPAPANRYVLLNSVRLREGDMTADGIKVERITPRGVVLDSRGSRFLLSAGG